MNAGEMTTYSITKELASLPQESRREVFDFIVFLRQRHGRTLDRVHGKQPSLKADPFLGIWADRSDMKDSAIWVRETREREWNR